MPFKDKEGQTAEASQPQDEDRAQTAQEPFGAEAVTRGRETGAAKETEGADGQGAESSALERPEAEAIQDAGQIEGKEDEEVAAYRGRIKALEKEVADYVRHLQRLQADFDNFRKRVRREQEELRERVTEELLRRLLPVVDNLERAAAAAGQEEITLEKLQTGVVMVYRQMTEFLLKEGASPLVSRGEEFDPNKHHAVATVETDEYDENTVVDELQKGYLFHGRLLRPALVRVAKRPCKEEKVIPLRPEEGEGDGQGHRD